MRYGNSAVPSPPSNTVSSAPAFMAAAVKTEIIIIKANKEPINFFIYKHSFVCKYYTIYKTKNNFISII